MSKHEKLLRRLLSRPKDFTIGELTVILKRLGFESFNKGKTSGSRLIFINQENGTKDIIQLHRPHPGNEIDSGALKDVITCLKDGGYI